MQSCLVVFGCPLPKQLYLQRGRRLHTKSVIGLAIPRGVQPAMVLRPDVNPPRKLPVTDGKLTRNRRPASAPGDRLLSKWRRYSGSGPVPEPPVPAPVVPVSRWLRLVPRLASVQIPQPEQRRSGSGVLTAIADSKRDGLLQAVKLRCSGCKSRRTDDRQPESDGWPASALLGKSW